VIPAPVVDRIDGVMVVRDDHIPGGTKRSFADQLIAGRREVVYASPGYGGAQIAIAHAARQQGAQATIFCAKRNRPHPRTMPRCTCIRSTLRRMLRLSRLFLAAATTTQRPGSSLSDTPQAVCCFGTQCDD